MKREWELIEGMPHYFSYMSLTLRIKQEGEWHVLQMLSFYSSGWIEIHKISISNLTNDEVTDRLKNYATKIFRLEQYDS